MAVGAPEYFTKPHLEAHRLNASMELAEQAVHCLELVAELVGTGLKFQFKGGNSLLLVLGEPKRFSIDVDIATDCPREELDACVQKVIGEFGVFTHWEKRQHKTKPWLPLASYYLFFESAVLGAETSIMLDVQLRRSPYRVELKPVSCGGLYRSGALVELPLPSSIIGDKLLTLGPNTLGIPVGKGKEAQRLKHVFDVSRLLSSRPDISAVRESFHACLRHENDIQERTRSADEVLDDTLSYCRSVLSYSTPPTIVETTCPLLAENVRGLAPFAGHLFEPGYGWSDLRRDMARVAFCVAAIRSQSLTDDEFRAALIRDGGTPEACWTNVECWESAAPTNQPGNQ